jgi:predicted nucleic acid-binding Zn ribbon protein
VRPPRRRPPQRIGELLPGLASRLGLEEELRGARAISSWRLVVEEHVPAAAGATRLVEVRPPALVVAADDAATAQELRLHSSVLLEAFARAPGGERLRELAVVVRPPGRGPSGQPR